jgi:transporter family protein
VLQFIPSLVSLFSLGTNTAISKKAIHTASRYQAIVYMYIILSVLLIAAGLVFRMQFSVPSSVLLILVANIIIGALAIISRYKAIELGKASIISPLGKTYVLLVILIGILFFGESLSVTKGFGALIILVAAGIISFHGKKLSDLSLESGVPFIALSIIGWGIYYSLLKPIVAALGPFVATVYLEIGITIFIVLYALIRKKNTQIPANDGAKLILASGFLVFIGSLAYSFSVEAIGIVLTAIIVSGTPVVNLLVSRIILKEELSRVKYAAVVLLVVGLIVLFGF